MKTSNYLYISYFQMYDMLYGIGGCLDNMDLEDAQDIARCGAYDIIADYDCILEAIHENLNEQFGYDETPEEPSEEYLDALEDAIQEKCGYLLFEITPKGEAHWDEMEDNYEFYEDYLKEGWIKSC